MYRQQLFSFPEGGENVKTFFLKQKPAFPLNYKAFAGMMMHMLEELHDITAWFQWQTSQIARAIK